MSDQRVEWSPGEMIGLGWGKVKADPGGVVLPLFVAWLIQSLPGQGLGMIAGIIGEQARAANDGDAAALSAGIQFVGSVVNFFLSAFFTGGVMTFLLNIVRGREYSFGDVFTGGRCFGTMFLTMFLAGLGTVIGIFLCIIPGIILALGWSMATVVVVDKNLSPIDALKESWRLTTGHKPNLLLYAVISIAVAILGLLACCVGIIPASAVIALGQVFIYDRLNSANLPTDEDSDGIMRLDRRGLE